MKAIRHIEEFIKEKIVKEQLPDKSRAESLIRESQKYGTIFYTKRLNG